MPFKILLLLCLMCCCAGYAQSDTTRATDSSFGFVLSDSAAVTAADSLLLPKKPLTWQQDTAFRKLLFNTNLVKAKGAVFAIDVVRTEVNSDSRFYILLILLWVTGLARAVFPKYFSNVFRLFLQSSQRQRHSADSIRQDALPSLLLNVVFILSGGLLLALLVRDDFAYKISLPLFWLYVSAALAIIYIAKSLFISLFGWTFSVQEPADNYRFIVFLVNKVGGLCLIPFLLLLLYASDESFETLKTIILVLIALLLVYRFIVSLNVVGKKLKIHPLHFFLYLCAVEILPLLIIYKVLLITKEL